MTNWEWRNRATNHILIGPDETQPPTVYGEKRTERRSELQTEPTVQKRGMWVVCGIAIEAEHFGPHHGLVRSTRLRLAVDDNDSLCKPSRGGNGERSQEDEAYGNAAL